MVQIKYAVITMALVAGALVMMKPGKENKQMRVSPAFSTVAFEPVAVIELFTSQGCSSCPPADRLMAKTISDATRKQQKILALSFHVDYWNRLGWTDPFSNAAFTQRQNDYVSSLKLEGAYTPQMIVNGSNEFVGSDENALSSSLRKALSEKAEVSFSKLNSVQENDGSVKLSYSLEGNYAGCDIRFAMLSLKESTSVQRGENGGHTLVNENVVRQFISKKATASGEIAFAASPSPGKGNMALLAFVQKPASGKIIGAAMVN